MAAGTQALDQRVMRRSFDGAFACRIDWCDDDRIRAVEAGAKFRKEREEPRIAVRLHDGDNLALGYAARRTQDRCDLDRVMSVIVEYDDTAMLASAGEAALDSGEAFEAHTDLFLGNAE